MVKNQAFQQIKALFLEVTILRHPRLGGPYFIQKNASLYGIGAMLYQLCPVTANGNVIAYASGTL